MGRGIIQCLFYWLERNCSFKFSASQKTYWGKRLLVVRTLASHAGNRSSTLRGTTSHYRGGYPFGVPPFS